MRQKFLVTAFGLVLALAACTGKPPIGGGGGAATAIPENRTGKIGQTVNGSNTALTVNEISRNDQIGTQVADPGDTLLVVDLTLRNTGSITFTYDQFFFDLTYDQVPKQKIVLGAPDPALSRADLAPGKSVEANIMFEIPTTAKGLTLYYEPLTGPWSGDPLQVDLGQ